MIVRVDFVGIVTVHGKRKGLRDHLTMHVGRLKDAEPLLLQWLPKSGALRGASGIFHPLGKYGEIKIESVKEVE